MIGRSLGWVFGSRTLNVLGVQGFAEYAQDQNGNLWYRFTDDRPDVLESWKLVAW